MNKQKIVEHVQSLGEEARSDISAGQWDDVMTDALYAWCGAETVEEMSEARRLATEAAE